MNILIFFGNQLNPYKGGTERVACLIADYLIQKGHNVNYMASIKSDAPNVRPSSFLPDSTDGPTFANISFVKDYIKTNNIEVIINEGASTDSVYLFSHEHIGDNIKILSHLHFNVCGDIDNFYKLQYLPFFHTPPKKAVINFFKRIKQPYNKWRAKRNKNSRYDYMLSHSDKIIVLSEKQRFLLNNFLKTKNSDKIIDIVNPLSFQMGITPDILKKKKKIIFVGRLEYSTKRVDRILKLWHKIHLNIPDWSLTIIGSGPDEERLKRLSEKLALKNIEFVGHTNPEPFYQDASILLLTSNHEGTPMVIPESMAFGVVPIVMNNFSDADMYISNGKSGFISKPFDITDMAEKVYSLTKDPTRLNKMSMEALMKIREIKNENLLNAWNDLINEK